MTETCPTIFAFFTKSPFNLHSLSSQQEWADKLKKDMTIPKANVVILENKDWDAPTLDSLDQNEVSNAIRNGIGQIKKILIYHGVPQNKLNDILNHVEIMTIPATMRAICFSHINPSITL